ncbi:MAG: hypothetical protein AAGJ18_13325 [Bacteroidota bacterium]
MAKKVWGTYFPIGIQFAWIVMPLPFKAINILTPDGERYFFDETTMEGLNNNLELEILRSLRVEIKTKN